LLKQGLWKACLFHFLTFKLSKGMKKRRLPGRHPRIRRFAKILLIMKMAFGIMLVSCLQLSAAGYSQEARLTLNMKQVTVGRVLKTIEKRTDYRFVYSNNFFPSNLTVDLDVKDAAVSDILTMVLQRTGFTFRKVDKDLIVITTRPEAVNSREIHGVVTNASGSPLEGVTVAVENSTIQTATNSRGEFSLEVPDHAVLVFTSIGYVTAKVPVNGNTDIRIVLTEASKDLGEVVVVGYGRQRKADLTGAVVSVKEDVVKNRPIANLNEALVGQLAGVNVALNDATPGGETSIKIRGIGSISAGNEPLYVVDGFPTTQTFANSILPSNIESVDVLKDASATAIYGSRGSNGVIMITTRTGKTGKAVINLNIANGLAKVARRDYYHLLNGQQYTEFAREERNNEWVRAGVGNQASDPNSVRPPQYQIPDDLQTWNGINTDWQDAIFRTALIQNYDLNVSGGSENVKYFFSGGYSGNDGVVIGTGFQKYTAQMKVDATLIKDVLQAGMNLLPSFSRQRVAQYAGTSIYKSVIASALGMPPNIPVYNSDGSYADDMHPYPGFKPIPNPVQLGKELQNHNTLVSSLVDAYLKLNITRDIEVRTSFGATLNYSRNDFYHPSTTPDPNAPAPITPYGSSSTSDLYNWLSETTINYQKNFARDHRINFLAGYSAQKEHDHSNSVSAADFPNDLVETLNAGVINGGGSSEGEWSLLSYIGRLNYAYRDKYLLTATFRADGSSRFGQNTKWGSFPSAAAGWVVSKESFLENNKTISFLKLRLSYGLTGNNNIPNYAHIGLLGYANQTFGTGQGTNYSGIFPTSLSNEDLSWEKAKEVDLGADIGLFNDRINLTLDYYDRKTSDLLLNVNLPSTTGFTSVLTNIGEVENKGYEIVLTSRNIDRGTLHWTTSFNIAYNQNKVLKLGPNGDPIYGFNGTRITAVGGPIGASRGLVQIGVLTQKEIDAGVPLFPGETAGDAEYLDVNKDGTISTFNGDDGVDIGDANPKYVFGMNNMVSYGNFDFNLFINGQTGGKTMDLTSQGLRDPSGANVLYSQYEGRYISEEQPGNGHTLRAGNINGGMPDTRLVQPTDYLRIRSVSLGYNFPVGKLRYITGLRAYLSVENLITWTSFEGFNPQSTAYGGSQTATVNGLTGGGAYPLPRIVSLGFNLSF
jgi:TonB-linked SusC/RagA family outer membrane protein